MMPRTAVPEGRKRVMGQALMVYDTGLRRGIYRDQASGRIVVVYNYMMRHEVRDKVYNSLYNAMHAGQDYWFRATNNRREHAMLGRVRSSNHLTGHQEAGLSVSEHPGYAMMGYRYCYMVTGDVAGHGSDGEPLLVNARALSKPTVPGSQAYRALCAQYDQDTAARLRDIGIGADEGRLLMAGKLEMADSIDTAHLVPLLGFVGDARR